MEGRHFGNPRFQYHTDIHQVQGQGHLVLHRPQPQGIHVHRGGAYHIGPRPPAHLQDSPGNQKLYRFPDRASANPKLFPQFKLIRQLGPYGNRGIQYVLVYLFLNLLCKQFSL